MAHKTIQRNGLTWYYFTNVEAADIAFLKSTFKFHPLTLKDVESHQNNSKVDVFRSYAFGVFQFPEIKKSLRRVVTHELDIYVGADYVVTIQKTNFRAMRDLFFKISGNERVQRDFFSYGPHYLLYSILHSVFTESNDPVTTYFAKILGELEQTIYETEDLKKALKEIGIIRRNILNFKRIMVPQANVINHLAASAQATTQEVDVGEYYDDIDDYIERVSAIINNQQEILEGLYLTSESLISHRTNEVIKLLTVISVAILPLTLFSGIYGMNIDLPFQNQPIVVGALFVGLFAVIVAAIWHFKKRRS